MSAPAPIPPAAHPPAPGHAARRYARIAERPAAAAMPARRIAGVSVADLDRREALALLDARIRLRRHTRVAFLNAHCANVAFEAPDYRRALSDFLVLPDGVGVDWAAKLLFGAPFRANLNGTDFVPALLEAARAPLRVALLGAAPGVAERAAAAFSARFPAHAFVVVSHGFLEPGEPTRQALGRLAAFRADLVLVAMGVPAQELFIARHIRPEHGTVVVAVGALLDFTAGIVFRAPRPVRAVRLEWAWRLALEPRRLFRRYVLGNPLFLLRTLRAARGPERLRP